MSEEERKPQQFRTQSVIKWALQFAEDGSNWVQVHQFMGRQCPVNVPTFYAEIPTLEGMMLAKRGWWIVRGIQGEFYAVKPDIFVDSYEPVARAESAPQANPWKEAMEEVCTCDHIDFYPDDAIKTLRNILNWEVQVALDPRVSEAAVKLQESGRESAPQAQTEWIETELWNHVNATMLELRSLRTMWLDEAWRETLYRCMKTAILGAPRINSQAGPVLPPSTPETVEYWKSRAETAELKVLTFNEEIAKLRPDSDEQDDTQYWRGIAQRLASEIFDARAAAKEAGYGSGSLASVIRNLTELSITARRALDELTQMRTVPPAEPQVPHCTLEEAGCCTEPGCKCSGVPPAEESQP